MRKAYLAPLLVVVVAACAGTGTGTTNLSPREQALQLYAQYELVQTATEIAVTSPLLASEPDVKDAIKAGEAVATQAVVSFDAAARPCIRQPDGSYVSDPTLATTCNPQAATLLLPTAQQALQQLNTELTKRGFMEEEN